MLIVIPSVKSEEIKSKEGEKKIEKLLDIINPG